MSANEENFYPIAQQIVKIFGKIFATKPYISIIDANGKIHYIDEPLSKHHLEFIQNFVKDNFKFMKVGEYSVPLGGVNLALFKISEKAVITIYTEKGFTGQLLAFKARMHEWSDKIDNQLGNVTAPSIIESKEVAPVAQPATESVEPSKPVVVERAKVSRKVPILVKKLTGKEKFSIESASILQFCNGNNSVDDICKETNIPKVKVNQTLGELKLKGWIKFKRVLS